MEHQSERSSGVLTSLQQPSPERPSRLEIVRDLQHTTILSLHQIRVIRSCNNYTEGPTASQRAVPPWATSRFDNLERTHKVINNNYEHQTVGHMGSQYGPRAPVLSRSTSTGSAASSGSNSSISSEQVLLGPPQPGHVSSQHWPDRAVQTQPKARTQPPPEEVLKPATMWKEEENCGSGHRFVCEQCGRCKCAECTAPRMLPSCYACGGQCLCSAQTFLEHGTCMCLVKGLFYHCSNDDEGDSCADSPCSLSPSHFCSRFLCIGLMSALFPCLLFYPPAKGCFKACQQCYDRVKRPGCRCRNSNAVYCKLENWSPPRAKGKPS